MRWLARIRALSGAAAAAVAARIEEQARRLETYGCRRGNHAMLIWVRATDKKVVPTSPAMEMMMAAGFHDRMVTWNGWCPRCGRPVEWSSFKPVLDKDGKIR